MMGRRTDAGIRRSGSRSSFPLRVLDEGLEDFTELFGPFQGRGHIRPYYFPSESQWFSGRPMRLDSSRTSESNRYDTDSRVVEDKDG